MPPCIAGMVLAFFILRRRQDYEMDTTDRRVQHAMNNSKLGKIGSLDWVGTILFVAAGILILLTLNWGSTEKWSTVKVIVSFAVGGALFLLCVAWETFLQLRQDGKPNTRLWKIFPMLPVEIYASLDVVACQAAAFAGGMVMLVMFYYLAIFYVIVSGKSATNAGVQLLWFAPGMV
jgi:hypothetical protein